MEITNMMMEATVNSNITSITPRCIRTTQLPRELPRRKRRRASVVSTSVLFLLSLALCSTCRHQQGVDAFGIRKWVSRRVSFASSSGGARKTQDESSWRFLADKSKNGETAASSASSWSKPANGGSSSPLQVRKRVRAVLEKARTRTGVDNNSSLNGSSNSSRNNIKPSNVVAEAASIGGLDDDYIIELKAETDAMTNGADNKNGASVPRVFPDEMLVVQRANGTGTAEARKPKDFDVIRGDVPAATQFCEPLPFELPKLSQTQIQALHAGERVQEQSRMGREGSGYVVVDVKVPPYVVWECLLDFEDYPSMISTVKEMQLYTSEKLNTGYVNEKPLLPGTGREMRHYGTPSVTRASFVLSKFRLNIAAVHKYSPHPDGDYMIFTLDKSCTNMVLKGAKGIWHTVENPDGREGYTRVYLLCEVKISRALPNFIVDYTADRAMPRATSWLKPYVESAAETWLNDYQ